MLRRLEREVQWCIMSSMKALTYVKSGYDMQREIICIIDVAQSDQLSLIFSSFYAADSGGFRCSRRLRNARHRAYTRNIYRASEMLSSRTLVGLCCESRQVSASLGREILFIVVTLYCDDPFVVFGLLFRDDSYLIVSGLVPC